MLQPTTNLIQNIGYTGALEASLVVQNLGNQADAAPYFELWSHVEIFMGLVIMY